MGTSIDADSMSVESFLASGTSNLFVIPEYQRPYEWGEDEIQTLFDDLWDFAKYISKNEDNDSTYFLGSTVSFINNDGKREIIDGQQRITSLFLLLRAIYTHLVATPIDERDKKTDNFIQKIGKVIWKTDKYTNEVVNFDDILIESVVLDKEENEILKSILRSGIADEKAKDNYSKNYIKFQELYEDASKERPLSIFDFILVILERAVVLPITADSQDTALTIFSTLNDRGRPLSDADIFKAKIYNHLDSENKTTFIEEWRDLESDADSVGESIQQLFYYYMFYLKALEGDSSTTIAGTRKYYFAEDNRRLFAKNLMEDLNRVLNIWKVVNSHEEIEDEPWSSNIKILQSLDILNSYPNEFWKYPVVVYYLTHSLEDNFEEEFALFLNKLVISLLMTYLMVPTVNAVKSDIIKLNIAIIHSPNPKFDFKEIDTSDLQSKIKNPHRNAVRMLLKMLAYQEQDFLLPAKWEVEHIFPQKWQNNYFVNATDSDIKERIEHLGNKLPFEKRLNIIAGNGYFERKKKEYAESNIVITKAMSITDATDWNLDSITERDVRVSDTIMNVLRQWNDDYETVLNESPTASVPSAEDLARIEEYKEKGWV